MSIPKLLADLVPAVVLALLIVPARVQAGVVPAAGKLPVVELPVVHASNDVLAVILSGDGGWADLDRDFGYAFQQQGVATLGVDCLKYFWKRREPDEVSRALEATLRHYLEAWHKRRLLLVGYSFGAGWLPFLVNRLPPDLRARVTLVTLLAPLNFANVEIKMGDWLTDVRRAGALEVPGEAQRLRLPVLCVYGAEQAQESACPTLNGANMQLLRMPGGHHFDHEYAPIEHRILREARAEGGATRRARP